MQAVLGQSRRESLVEGLGFKKSEKVGFSCFHIWASIITNTIFWSGSL